MNSSTDYANYIEQRQAFLELLRPDCRNRVLLIRGKSGAGKSELIKACCGSEPVCRCGHIPIDLNSSISAAEIFYWSGDCLGWNAFPSFTKRTDTILSDIHVNIEKNQMMGMNNKIEVALRAENLQDRNERLASLTQAWFEDMSAFNQIVLLVMDTFEKAPIELRDWISGPFLARLRNAKNIRVVIAGQETPAPNHVWGIFCKQYELKGIHNPEHWIPVIKARGHDIQDLKVLNAVCRMFDGLPKKIMEMIEAM